MHRFLFAATSAVVFATSGNVSAQVTNFPNDVTITGDLTVDSGSNTGGLFVDGISILDNFVCVGLSCTATELFTGDTDLKIKSTRPVLKFEDNSGGTNPTRDWALRANDGSFGVMERFILQDLDAGTNPFSVEGGAPNNALWLGASGDIGFGTSLPQAELHVVGSAFPALRLEQNTSSGNLPRTWEVSAFNDGLGFHDVTANTTPVVFETFAPNNSLRVVSTGNVGMGLNAPTASLHVQRKDGTAQLKIEETDIGTSPRTLLNMQNNGRPEMVFGNSATNGEWSFGAGTNFVLKQGTVGSLSADKNKVFTLKPNGDLDIEGTLTTMGGTCGGGCDRVFTERAVIPAAEYSAKMWGQGYLPHVGPTKEGAPINVSQKLGGMLNALEHAHVFIDAQRAEIAGLKADKAALEARMAKMEAQMAAILAAE